MLEPYSFIKQALRLSLEAEMLNQDPQLFERQQVAGTQTNTKKLLKAVAPKKKQINQQFQNKTTVTVSPQYSRSIQSQYATLFQKAQNSKLKGKKKLSHGCSPLSLSQSRNSSSVDMISKKSQEKIQVTRHVQQAKLIYRQQSTTMVVDQIYRNNESFGKDQNIILQETEYANADFLKRLKRILKELIISKIIAVFSDSDTIKLFPFLQEFLVVKFLQDTENNKNDGLKVQAITYEIEKQLSWGMQQNLMMGKLNKIQSQVQFIATILCGDSDLVCLTIHSISESSITKGFEPFSNRTLKEEEQEPRKNSGLNYQNNKCLLESQEDKIQSKHSLDFKFIKVQRQNSNRNGLYRSQNEQNFMLIQGSQSSSEQSIGQKRSNDSKQVSNKSSDEVIKRPLPEKEKLIYSENISFQDLQQSRGHQNVDFNTLKEDIMRSKVSSDLASAHFYTRHLTGNSSESMVQGQLQQTHCIGMLELNLESQDKLVQLKKINKQNCLDSNGKNSQESCQEMLKLRVDSILSKSWKNQIQDSSNGNSSDNLLGTLTKKDIQPRISNQSEPLEYQNVSMSSVQMVMPIVTTSNQNQQDQRSSNEFTVSGGFTIQNTHDKISPAELNLTSSLSYNTKRSNKSYQQAQIESGNIRDIPIDNHLLSANNTLQNVNSYGEKRNFTKQNGKMIGDQYAKSIQHNEGFKDSLQNQKNDDTVKTLHEDRIKRPIFLSSNIEDLFSNLAFSNRNRYNKRQQYINQIKKLEGQLVQQKLFMNMVIHDLRNPSESIHKGLAHAIEEHQKVINQIFQEAKHLVGKDLAEKLNQVPQISEQQHMLAKSEENYCVDLKLQSQIVPPAQVVSQPLQMNQPSPLIQARKKNLNLKKQSDILDINEYINSQKRKFELRKQINSDSMPENMVQKSMKRNQSGQVQNNYNYDIQDEEMDEDSKQIKLPVSSGIKVFHKREQEGEIKFVEKIVYKHKDIQQYEKQCQTDLKLLEGKELSQKIYQLIKQIPAIANMNFNQKELQGFFINVENFIEITKILQIPLNLKISDDVKNELIQMYRKRNENENGAENNSRQIIDCSQESKQPLKQIMNNRSSNNSSNERLHQCQSCLLLQSFIVNNLQRFQNANNKLDYYIQNSVNQAHMMNNIISDLLDLAQLEKSTFSVNAAEFNIIEAVKEAFQIVQFQADSKKLKLLLNFDTNMPFIMQRVSQDKRRILQVLLNFISNSIKFTKIGGFIKVHINILENQPYVEQEEQRLGNSNNCQLKRVNSQKFDSENLILQENEQVSFVDQTKYVKIQLVIEDNGVGISKDEQRKLFQDYSKLREHSKINHKGTGLGLSICKKIVEQMGGKCTTESVLGDGTKFIITLTTKVVDKVSTCAIAPVLDDFEYFENFHQHFSKTSNRNLNSKQTDLNKDQLALEQEENARFQTFKFRSGSDEDFSSGSKSKNSNQQVIDRMLTLIQTFYVQQRATLDPKKKAYILKMLKPSKQSSVSLSSSPNRSQEECKIESLQISSMQVASQPQQSVSNVSSQRDITKRSATQKKVQSYSFLPDQPDPNEYQPIGLISNYRKNKNISFLDIFNFQKDNSRSNSIKKNLKEEEKSSSFLQLSDISQSGAPNSSGQSGGVKFSSSKFELSKSKQDSSKRSSSLQIQNINQLSPMNQYHFGYAGGDQAQPHVDSFSYHVMRQMENVKQQQLLNQRDNLGQPGPMSEMIIGIASPQNDQIQVPNLDNGSSSPTNVYERIVRSYKKTKLRLLVANDDSFQLFIICQQLSMLPNVGQIDQACNGQHALDLVLENEKEALKNGERCYDVIFLDLNMPIQDGYEAQQNICNFYEKLQKESRELNKQNLIDSGQSQMSDLLQSNDHQINSYQDFEFEQEQTPKSDIGLKWLQDLKMIYKAYLDMGKPKSQNPELMDVVKLSDKNSEVSQETKHRQKMQRLLKAHLKNVKYNFLKFLKRPFIFAYSQLVTDEIQQKVIKSGFDGCLEQVTQKSFQDFIIHLVDTSIEKQIHIQLSNMNCDLDSLKRVLSDNGSGSQRLSNLGSGEYMNQNGESAHDFEADEQQIIQSRNPNNFTQHFNFDDQIHAIQEDKENEDKLSNNQINPSRASIQYQNIPSFSQPIVANHSIIEAENNYTGEVLYSSGQQQQRNSAQRRLESPINQVSFGSINLGGSNQSPLISQLQQQPDPQSNSKSDDQFSIEDDLIKIFQQDYDSSVQNSKSSVKIIGNPEINKNVRLRNLPPAMVGQRQIPMRQQSIVKIFDAEKAFSSTPQQVQQQRLDSEPGSQRQQPLQSSEIIEKKNMQ